jgi:putative RecB family exonuclease
VPVYSHSRLSAFEKCPLQYKYRYLDRIKRDTQGIEAFMGNRVHEALEKLYRDLLMERRPPLDEITGLYHRSWDENFSDRVRIVRSEYTADHYRQVGERCLAAYYRRYEPFDQAATLGLEERVHLALDGGDRYQLQGFIDRLARAGDGIYEIHDYKTSASLPSDQDLRKDRQLTLYQMAVERRFPDAREVRLVWHYLVFDQEMRSKRTPQEVEQHRGRTIAVIDEIETWVRERREFPPRESALCRWCEYRDICPAQKHLARVECLPPNRYLTDDGVRLVERLAALRSEREALDREVEQVEEAILAFASREGATVLRGSEHRVRLEEAPGPGGHRRISLSRLKPEQMKMFA